MLFSKTMRFERLKLDDQTPFPMWNIRLRFVMACLGLRLKFTADGETLKVEIHTMPKGCNPGQAAVFYQFGPNLRGAGFMA